MVFRIKLMDISPNKKVLVRVSKNTKGLYSISLSRTDAKKKNSIHSVESIVETYYESNYFYKILDTVYKKKLNENTDLLFYQQKAKYIEDEAYYYIEQFKKLTVDSGVKSIPMNKNSLYYFEVKDKNIILKKKTDNNKSYVIGYFTSVGDALEQFWLMSFYKSNFHNNISKTNKEVFDIKTYDDWLVLAKTVLTEFNLLIGPIITMNSDLRC